ncbi:MAG: DUF4258 domain-containing protein [Ignavibacteriales bacterium]
MEIKFSRHARRRMQLYKILQEDVINTIKAFMANNRSVSGKKEIVNKELSLKIVFSVERDKIVVITAYPLKKGRIR